MKFMFSLLFIIGSIFLKAQDLYSKAYGNPKNPPVIFIHGGPGGNATLFEGTTAQKLADKGFYVIVYVSIRKQGEERDRACVCVCMC
jgi:proline iminopeptidase